MGHREAGSPLPPDPAGREDIMPAGEGEEAGPSRETTSPLSPDAVGREDVIGGERRNATDSGDRSTDDATRE